MKSYQLGPIATVTAAEALTKRRFVAANGTHTVDLPAIGVTLFDTDSGDEASVQISGIAVVEAGGTVTVATHPFVKSDADGKAVANDPSAVGDVDKICGIPMSSGGSGEFILVKLL